MRLIVICILLFFVGLESQSQVYKTRYASSLILKNDPNDANSITILSPTPASSTQLQLPQALGADGTYLSSNGSGGLNWVQISGTAVPQGVDGSIQYNDSGSMGGDSLFVFIDSTNSLYVGIEPFGTELGVTYTPNAIFGKNTVQGRVAIRSSGSTNYMTLAADSSMTTDLVFEMPAVNGQAMEALVTDGNGVLSWGGNVTIGPISEDDPDGSNNDINNNPDFAYIGGGQDNDINNNPDNVSIYGGDDNDINNNSDGSTIIGGSDNDLNNQDSYSFLIGGNSNDINNNAQSSGVAGGESCDINNQTSFSVIMGGDDNDINNNSESSIMFAGRENDLNNQDADLSAVLGGRQHDLQQSRNAILGGRDNAFNNNNSDEGIHFGGEANVMNNCAYCAVMGGTNNDPTDNYSVIMAGQDNYIDKDYSAIIFGNNNQVQNQADYSIMGGEDVDLKRDYTIGFGRNINPNNHDGVVMFADANTNNLSSNSDNQWNCRFSNGYRLFTNGSSTAGVQMNGGATSWSSISDSTKKHLILELDYREVYEKLPLLGIYSWNYIGSDKSIRNYSPMAQDFYALFGRDEIGYIGSDTTIAELDLTAIFLAGVKGAQEEMDEIETKIGSLERNADAIESRAAAIRKRIEKLTK